MSLAERRQEEKDRRRTEIVDAAEALYRELGWDAVTMERVAKRGRLSRALVYVYFKDKHELHCAIALRALETLHERFLQAVQQAGTGLEKIVALGVAYMAFGRELPHYFDACARLEARTPEGEPGPQEQLCYRVGAEVHNVVVQALLAGQQDGTVRQDLGDLMVTSRVLWGFTHGVIQIALTKEPPLQQVGISVPQLTEHAIFLMRQMLSATPARTA